MSSRRAVLSALERLAFAAELLDDPRARAYASAAWAVRQQKGEIEELFASGQLAELRGLGKSTLAIVEDVLTGREPAALVTLSAKLPPGLFEIRKIRGLGPKKVKALWSELGITTLGELEYACRENRLIDLKGFGRKTQAQVLEQIAALRDTQGKMRRDQALSLAAGVVAALGEARAAIAGDLRRGLELIEDLPIVTVADAIEVPAPARLITATADGFGAALVIATGSKAHVDALRERARQRSLLLDESGLWRDGERVPCPEEDDVYAALGLSPTPAERRDTSVLVEVGRALPALVRREDLRGALHNHTVASDGAHTLSQMRAAATERRLEYLGISDHSVSAFYAKGLEVERLAAQRDEIARLAGEGAVLLSGVESDILEHGELDYPDEILAGLEVVVASVHKRFAHDRAAATARLVAAASHPRTAIIGHPTGRLLLGRPPVSLDMEAFLDACAKSGCAVELNANPHRLDLSAEHLVLAKERGVLVSIAADAHHVAELDYLAHGVSVARRAGLTAEDVLNARSLSELRVWLAGRRPLASPA